MRNFFFTIVAAIMALTARAGKISGIITDEYKAPLPYATISIKGSGTGTTANGKGFYSLELSPGNYTLVVEYVGFVTEEKQITITDADLKLDVQLYANASLMSEVVVTSKGEDPAYSIIRQAIKKKDFYQHQTDSLAVNIYIKGLIRTVSIPKKVFGQKVDRGPGDGLDSAGKGVLMVSESNLLLEEIPPQKSKITVLSSIEQGNTMGLSFSKVTSFYTNNVSIFDAPGISRGYISPIADGALNFYRFKLLNTFNREGITVKTIRVIPKRKFEPLFSGTIEIADSTWNIYSLDLALTKDYQLELVDTLRIRQLHGAIANNIWKTKNQIISVYFNQFGFKAAGNFVNVYSNYDPQPNFSKNHFNNVVMKFDTAYYKKDTAFWQQSRPITLEDDEKRYYTVKDSMAAVARNRPKSYYDSLRHNQKITIANILWKNQTYNWYGAKNTISYQLRGLAKGLEYNTVEGIAIKVNQGFSYRPKNGRYNADLTWRMRYGFSNHHFNSDGTLIIKDKDERFRNRYLSFAGGKRVSQFNNDEPIGALTNSFYTLFLRSNYMKLYESWFGNIRYNNKFESGLGINIGATYENRTALANTADYSFFRREKQFTPNHPEALSSVPFEKHQAVVADITISYQPGQRYIEYPKYKTSIGSEKPVFNLNFIAGIPDLLGSDVNYQKWNFSIRDNLDFKLAGLFKYKMGAGGFISTKEYSVPDMKHFNGNQTFYNINYLNSFQLAPYYAYSNVAKFYGEGNIEHHFNGLLTNKIPLFNRLKWNLVAGSNAFYVNKSQYYAEGFVGLENIFKLFRVDFIAGYQPLLKTQLGVRIGFGGLLGGALQFEK